MISIERLFFTLLGIWTEFRKRSAICCSCGPFACPACPSGVDEADLARYYYFISSQYGKTSIHSPFMSFSYGGGGSVATPIRVGKMRGDCPCSTDYRAS